MFVQRSEPKMKPSSVSADLLRAKHTDKHIEFETWLKCCLPVLNQLVISVCQQHIFPTLLGDMYFPTAAPPAPPCPASPSLPQSPPDSPCQDDAELCALPKGGGNFRLLHERWWQLSADGSEEERCSNFQSYSQTFAGKTLTETSGHVVVQIYVPVCVSVLANQCTSDSFALQICCSYYWLD